MLTVPRASAASKTTIAPSVSDRRMDVIARYVGRGQFASATRAQGSKSTRFRRADSLARLKNFGAIFRVDPQTPSALAIERIALLVPPPPARRPAGSNRHTPAPSSPTL